MDVVVTAAVGEQEIDVVEACDVGDGGGHIAIWIDLWEVHVTLCVDSICVQCVDYPDIKRNVEMRTI